MCLTVFFFFFLALALFFLSVSRARSAVAEAGFSVRVPDVRGSSVSVLCRRGG